MANTFRISAAYWNKLNDKEKFFMQSNAIKSGIAYCKRILTLANLFPGWEEIHCSSLFIDGKSQEVSNSWLIIQNNQVVGIIKKTSCFGISERVYVNDLSGFREIWNNWKTKNPSSLEKQEIAQSVMSLIA